MASPLTIQPSSKDSFMYQAQPNTNYSKGTELEIHAFVSYAQRIPMEFPVVWGTDPPAGATISLAKLYLYYSKWAVADPVGRTMYAERLLRLDWSESQSTWNSYKSGSTWTTAGADSNGNDYTSTNRASVVIPASPGWVELDVTEQVKSAQTGDINVAFRLKDSDDGTGSNFIYYFYSREYTDDTAKCPKLVITYIIEKTSSDSGAGVDTVVVGSPAADLIGSDSGSGLDIAGLIADLIVNDSGVGLDAVVGVTKGEVFTPRRTAYDGYRCFIEQYVKNKVSCSQPWKLPDGTKW